VANTLNSGTGPDRLPDGMGQRDGGLWTLHNWLDARAARRRNLNDLCRKPATAVCPHGRRCDGWIRMAQGPMRGEALGGRRYPVDPGANLREDQTEQAPSRQGSFNPDIDRAGEHKPGETSDQFQHGVASTLGEPAARRGANGVKAGTSMSPQQVAQPRNIGLKPCLTLPTMPPMSMPRRCHSRCQRASSHHDFGPRLNSGSATLNELQEQWLLRASAGRPPDQRENCNTALEIGGPAVPMPHRGY